MKTGIHKICFLAVLLYMGLAVGVGFGQPIAGKPAPLFTLSDVNGRTYALEDVRAAPMLVLYFFDAASPSSAEGLVSLDRLAQQFEGADLRIWGITRSSAAEVSDFIAGQKPGFPVLLDDRDVSGRYQARLVLPTVCILGPELRVLDYFQGGGKTTEVMLVRLAERQLQRRQYQVARAITEQVEKSNPANVEAAQVSGYAAVKAGDLQAAERTFQRLADRSGDAGVIGKEGLSRVYAEKGETEKALALATEVESRAPDRSYVHVVKGDILYRKNRIKEAEDEFRKAARKPAAPSYQKAAALNKLGRVRAEAGDYAAARDLYSEAVDIDPYYIEVMSNTAVTYEKEGRWDKALEAYRQALKIDPQDRFSLVLAQKAQQMLDLKQDVERKKRMDALVEQLAQRFRDRQKTATATEDAWTSRPLVLTFVDFQEKGGLAERDGLSDFITTELTDHLNTSGRLEVVERMLVERLLEGLNLGSSDLADPETSLRLGQVLAARVIGTGSLLHLPAGSLMSLRLIDTETSALTGVFNRQIDAGQPMSRALYGMNRDILQTVVSRYPLQGFVVRKNGDTLMLNIGANQGVVQGVRFEVVRQAEPIEYKGRLLQGAAEVIGQLEVVRIDPDLCYARIVKQTQPIQPDDKVREMPGDA